MMMTSLKKRARRQGDYQGWFLASPYLIFTLVFFLIPLVWSLFLVFQQWDLISPTPIFVGLANFREALTSPRVLQAFLVTYKFMLIFVPLALLQKELSAPRRNQPGLLVRRPRVALTSACPPVRGPCDARYEEDERRS